MSSGCSEKQFQLSAFYWKEYNMFYWKLKGFRKVKIVPTENLRQCYCHHFQSTQQQTFNEIYQVLWSFQQKSSCFRTIFTHSYAIVQKSKKIVTKI